MVNAIPGTIFAEQILRPNYRKLHLKGFRLCDRFDDGNDNAHVSFNG